MLWPGASIGYSRLLILQRLSGSTPRPLGAVRFAFPLDFLAHVDQLLVPDFRAVRLEKVQDGRPDHTPLLARQAGVSGQLHVIDRQSTARVPHGHEKQKVSAVLFGRQVAGVPEIVIDHQRHKWRAAH